MRAELEERVRLAGLQATTVWIENGVVPNMMCDINFTEPSDLKHLPANASKNVLDETVDDGLGVEGDRWRVRLAVHVHASQFVQLIIADACHHFRLFQ